MKRILLGILFFAPFAACHAADTLDLSGEWKLALDPGDLGLAAGPAGWNFPDTIKLPSTLET